jgi:hypothetical protein
MSNNDYKFDYPATIKGVSIALAVINLVVGLFFLVEYGDKQTVAFICMIAGFFSLLFSGLMQVLIEIRDKLNAIEKV